MFLLGNGGHLQWREKKTMKRTDLKKKKFKTMAASTLMNSVNTFLHLSIMKTFLLILSGQLKTNIKLKRIIIHHLAVSKNNIKLNTKN